MVGMRGKWWAPEANGGHRRRPADASAGRQRQVVGGGVKWQVVGTGGKRWAFKPKAIGGLRTRMAAEASGGCQSRPKKENNQPEVAVMAATGGGGADGLWESKKQKKKGKQSNGGGCDGGRRRWWRF